MRGMAEHPWEAGEEGINTGVQLPGCKGRGSAGIS